MVELLIAPGVYRKRVERVSWGLTKARGYNYLRVMFDEGFPNLWLVRHPRMDLYHALWTKMTNQPWLVIAAPRGAERPVAPEDASWLLGRTITVRIRHELYKDGMYVYRVDPVLKDC